MPASLCIRKDLGDERIFAKWQNPDYLAQAQRPGFLTDRRHFLQVYHHSNGPLISVECCEFIPSHIEQVRLWGKSESGWKCLETGALSLHPKSTLSDLHIEDYVSNCVPHVLTEIGHGHSISSIAGNMRAEGLVKDAQHLLTATYLLVTGWQLGASPPITDPSSPYYGSSPAPRVLQNELDRRLEWYISSLESRLLADLRAALVKRTAPWNDIYLTGLLVLAVVEIDSWRLMYWIRHKEEAYKWRHPDSAQKLVEKAIFYVNMILAHLHFFGEIPDAFTRLGAQMEAKRPGSSYQETNHNSLDGALTRLGLIGGDLQFVKWDDFVC
ncbi:hypothetical protein MCOR31_010377 [Pyricularia oryzae]|nr:hypothetical protein MCOR31_010377 [Pyricularia oryzae]KAI6535052.1 hypothetical protein MCOR05_006103 [Pyricularia oryzae]